uniref:Adenylosuccinate lyase n=1 Tax=viral metagenome TaxID=1070528 RepID=A0A6C0E9G2_9ZZZZ
MELHPICPLDDIRYGKLIEKYSSKFNNFEYYKQRFIVEMKYLRALLTDDDIFKQLAQKNPILTKDSVEKFYINDFTKEDYEAIVEIEKTTNHDVKAIEYYIHQLLDKHGMSELKPYVHFGLTSQDVNSVAMTTMISKCFEEIENDLLILIDTIKTKLCKQVPMLCFTHGQPAVPSRMDKEMAVYTDRLLYELGFFDDNFTVKFGGAVGNLNAHYFVFPEIDWHRFMTNFVRSYGFVRSEYTKQIDNYESITRQLDCLKRIMVILQDFTNNVWLYIHKMYFIQESVAGEVGSSTMPHKVNPINFENAMGNLALTIGFIQPFVNELPKSLFQRDLKDLTMFRSLGMIFGYAGLSMAMITKGITRLSINEKLINTELNENVSVLAEAYQVYLKAIGKADSYEELSKVTKGKVVTYEILHDYVDALDIDETHKEKLKQLKVEDYIGVV